ncbi:MAG: Gfo/Idh/MocA family oxidoreductase [Gemmataceae bacterium]|nr:Gfo/Idh/MocA family oxidoreductase [Gemmataceae bacterium]
MKKARWGILGVAKINDRLLPSFAKARNLELFGIASRSLDRAQAAAKAAGIPQAYGSYEALLDDPNIDIVYNPLPNTLHAEWTKKAADRGKHVLCEKPLTATAPEAQEVVDYCAARKVNLMDGFMWPHHPRTKMLRDYLDQGKIGAVQRVVSAFTFKMEHLDTKNIRLQPDLGGGSLLDVGCYPIYGIRWAMKAEPVRVQAYARYVNGCDVEMHGTLWFPENRIANFDCGFVHPFRQWLEITGTEATAYVHEMWVPGPKATWVTTREKNFKVEMPVDGVEGEDQIQHMLENFSRSVLEKTPVSPPPTEAVKTLKVLDALTASAKTDGTIVEL